MKIRTYAAGSLREYIECISEVSKLIGKEKKDDDIGLASPPVLWFRGQNKTIYPLLPSLYRNRKRVETGGGLEMLYEEEIRVQHYMAKNFHLLQAVPSTKMEWLEVMQHHGIKTRLLDWSESAIHSVLFALESFFDGKAYDDEYRHQCTPCVWILDPSKLNKLIFQEIRNELAAETDQTGCISGLREELTERLEIDAEEVDKLLLQYSSFEEYMEIGDTHQINYILNLSKISEELLKAEKGLRNFDVNGGKINPYYYAIARIYSDGLGLSESRLPPLAIVNPYHSERIKAQKGVFTVFPYYREHEGDRTIREMGINPGAMDSNKIARECLFKIDLHSPQEIAYELMAAGINTSWLYPEMPIIANEIENRKVF